MNYKQYLEIKKDCEIKVKIFSFGLYIIALLSVLQTVFLFFKVNFTMSFADLILLNKLYTEGYSQVQLGNTVFAGICYVFYFLIVIAFVTFSFMTLMERRLPYIFALAVYGLDTLLCFITGSYFQMLFHVVFIIIIGIALKNQHTLKLLKNNMWGYK